MTLAALLGVGGVGALLKTWLDHTRAKRKATDEVALSLVEQLRADQARDRADAKNERALCEANLAVMRHRVNNLAEMFNGLLLVVKLAPEKAAEYVTELETRRRAQEAIEAAEKATVQAAMVTATAPGDVA